MLLPKYINMKRLPGYTLIEMLIVLTIFLILSAFSFSAFSGLRDTVTLNEDILTLQQEIRWAQRSALFLERGTNERWIYGIGIDFSRFEEEKVYTLFKWCSQYREFGPSRTRSVLPNFDPQLSLGALNGDFPVSATYLNSSCSANDSENEIVRVSGRIDGTVAKDFAVEIPDSVNAQGDSAGSPVYVLFEAVSGRMFLYDSAGSIVNYDSDGDMVSEPVDFLVEITAPSTGRKKSIQIGNISGKMSLESEET